MTRKYKAIPRYAGPLSLSIAIGCGLLAGLPAAAQETLYAVTENSTIPQSEDSARTPTAEGPVRLARFCYLRGAVQWRANDEAAWDKATVNLPVRQGAEIKVPKGGRVEIQFDDGSILRLGSNALAVLKTLSSDSTGEFTEIRLLQGLAALRPRHAQSVYQCDTPLVAFKATGPAKIRIGVASGVEIGVREGAIQVGGNAGDSTLQTGEFLYLTDAFSSLTPGALPEKDSWDLWNDERDAVLADAADNYHDRGLPENIALVAGDLDVYGDWWEDAQYGNVWTPRDVGENWKPYLAGHWVTLKGLGMTWVSDEPWGWAPYHYGTWIHRDYGWAWVPGPVYQYWSPALVRFEEVKGKLAWRPLGPTEVQYPTMIAFGFNQRDWYRYFSIGQVASYPATTPGACPPVVYDTTVINEVVVNAPTYVEETTYVEEPAAYPSGGYYGGGYYGLHFGFGHHHYPSYYNPAPYYPYSQYVPYNNRPGHPQVVIPPEGYRPRIPPHPHPENHVVGSTRPPTGLSPRTAILPPDRTPIGPGASQDFPGRVNQVRESIRHTAPTTSIPALGMTSGASIGTVRTPAPQQENPVPGSVPSPADTGRTPFTSPSTSTTGSAHSAGHPAVSTAPAYIPHPTSVHIVTPSNPTSAPRQSAPAVEHPSSPPMAISNPARAPIQPAPAPVVVNRPTPPPTPAPAPPPVAVSNPARAPVQPPPPPPKREEPKKEEPKKEEPKKDNNPPPPKKP